MSNRRWLVNQRAAVTGASSGIGRAISAALAQAGADVALGARSVEGLYETARLVQEAGRQALVIQTDVSDPEQARGFIRQAVGRWGGLDVLVANAGAYIRGEIASSTLSHYQDSMAVNFYGAVVPVLEVLPVMQKQRSGHIVLMSSIDGRKGLPLDAPYVSAKFALSGFGEVLRQELHGTGIHATIVYPGRVDTPMIGDLSVPAVSAKITPEQVARATLRGIRRHQPEVITPPQGALLVHLDALSPRLADWFVRQFRLEGRYE
ncbi:MAG: SDR family NAD(P)-dependent oxidoreductase [Anaerolineae bacterium]|nr:SDR family NAD(P)-dependent oxidoreductase [Anaerolineae bacterium]